MGSKFRQWVMMLGVLGLLSVVAPAQVVQACSFGPSNSLNQTIETVDYIVKATVIEVDDASVNAILQATTYLMGGSGPERLLLSRGSPSLSAIAYEHHYDTGCSGVGPIYPDVGRSAYFAVQRAANGAYVIPLSSQLHGLALDSDSNTSVRVRIDPDGEEVEENIQRLEISGEQGFIDLVAELSGETPEDPQPLHYGFPWLAPLLITTENGRQYVFPVDGGNLVEQQETVPIEAEWSPIAYPSLLNVPPFCAAVECRIWTPDRSLNGTQVDENTLHFDYGWLDEPLVVEGQAFAFSPTSEAVVVWNDNHLNLLLISNMHCDDACISGGFVPYLDEIAALPLNVNADAADFYGLARWSADGTTLTYSDADGIWIFDIFRQSEAELVISSEGDTIPTPLYLSTSGRYLGYTWDRDGADWLTLDRMNGQVIENAIISPNERYFVQIAPPNPEPRPDVAGCNVPIMVDCRYVIFNSPRYFAWIGAQSYVISRCSDDTNEDCTLGAGEMSYLMMPTPRDLPVGRGYSGWLGDVDYQPNQQLLAFVIAPQTIAINDGRNSFELSDQLDGEIVDIEWLPSLFYHASE